MSKKWLYSVAAAALLIAGQAAGITIYDALSNGFWSTEVSQTEESLNASTTDNYKEKYKKEKTEQIADGCETKSYTYTKKAQTTDDIVWAQKKLYTELVYGNEKKYTEDQVIRIKNCTPKERLTSEEKGGISYMETCPTNISNSAIQHYFLAPVKKGDRPTEPFFPSTEWFRQLTSEKYPGFCYSEFVEKAETNILSEFQSEIKGVVQRKSHLIFSKIGFPAVDPKKDPEHYDFWGHVTYPYTKTLTVVGDQYLRVEQTITEDSSFDYTTKGLYYTEYEAFFNKKGVWKKSAEMVNKWRKSDANSWYTNYFKMQKERN